MINDIPALVHIIAWCRPGDKPLSEPMRVSLPTHICVTRFQWVKETKSIYQIQQNTGHCENIQGDDDNNDNWGWKDLFRENIVGDT